MAAAQASNGDDETTYVKRKSSADNGMRILGPSTLVPLGAVITIITVVVFINNRLLGIEYEMRAMNSKMAIIETNGTTATRAWIKLFKAQNPTLSVPDLDE